ncbi:MAG: hypothetical protein ACLP59_16330 [Bryobacteraceae bacterium]
MTDTITAGSILLEKHTHLPNSMRLQSEPDASGWATLNGTRPAFEKEVHEAGWTFFFMAGAMHATVFGFDRKKTLRAALRRLITNVKSHDCNAIEITEVRVKSFLKVPYVSVSAHARHLQKGLTFSAQIFADAI